MTDYNLPVTIGGITFKNPFFVASGPTTKSVKQLVRIEETGWAAASIKLSIDPAPYINRKPRYALFKGKNALAFTAEKRLTFEQGLTLVREAKKVLTDLKLFANITYAGDAGVPGWVNMAKQFEEAGADVIELNMCCPNMSYNVSLTSGGKQSAAKQTGASLGQQADVVAEIVRAIKKEIHIPLFVKLTPEGGQIAHVAAALYEAGADAVGGTANRLGIPDIDIENPEQAIYHLQDEISMSCYCGSWLKPLALRDTYEIRKVCGMEPKIMAAGGITKWQDAVETVLVGGNLLGICSETLISGYDIVRPMIAGMKEYMERHGYRSLDDFCGKLVPVVKTAPELTLYDGYARIKEPNLSGPCKAACPLNVPVQAFIQKVAEGDLKGAYEKILTKGPIQLLCAYACKAPCEEACARGAGGDPIKIREIKQYLFEKARAEGWEATPAEKAAENERPIAVVGSGPAALSAAYELLLGGYDVTLISDNDLFSKGLIYWSIQAGHLPQDAYFDLLYQLKEMGLRMELNVEDTSDENLAAFGFERILRLEEDFSIQTDAKLPEELNRTHIVLYGKNTAIFDVALAYRKRMAQVHVVFASKIQTHETEERMAEAEAAGVKIIRNATLSEVLPSEIKFSGAAGETISLSCNAAMIVSGNAAVSLDMLSGIRAAIKLDEELRAGTAELKMWPRPVPVKREAVLARNGYIGDTAKNVVNFETDEDVIREASRCLKCGCGEGCQLCKTICTDFAPQICGEDQLCINEEDCVACGMCFNRCPNHNIEMVNKGVKI